MSKKETPGNRIVCAGAGLFLLGSAVLAIMQILGFEIEVDWSTIAKVLGAAVAMAIGALGGALLIGAIRGRP